MFSVRSLKDVRLSTDGSNAVFDFEDDRERILSLKFNFLGLMRLSHEILLVLSKLRHFQSNLILPILRPARCRAEIQTDDTTQVVVSFQLPTGLDLHYGLQAHVAEALAKQLLQKSEQAKRSNPATRN